MDEQSLIRHYLPAISAFVAFVLFALFFPFAEPAEKLGESFDLKAQVAGAQSIPAGDGLAGQYFQSSNCSGTSKTQVDGTIDFTNDSQFGVGYHDPCIRWTGQIYIDGGTGNYTFHIQHDDGVILHVNNQKIFENQFWNYNVEEKSQEINLTDKRRYDIKLEFNDRGGPGDVILSYSSQNIGKQVIPQRVLYSRQVQCSDNSDNDNDGQTDFGKDPGCESVHDDSEGGENECIDLKDNDGDGRIDFGTGPQNDPGCSSSSDTSEGDEEKCRNNKDDDGDGKIDFGNDPGCSSTNDNDENDPVCVNGIDDDGDGRTDYPSDPGCSSKEDGNEGDEAQCKNNKDDDADGKKDFPADFGCSSEDDTNEKDEVECFNGEDDDGDGRIDFGKDPGCTAKTDTNEGDEEKCRNNFDDDKDGKIDFPNDKGCSSEKDIEEGDEAQCDNDRDDDSDGKIDLSDPGCSSKLDDNEANPQCSDGADNDHDGKVDMADRGCESEKDDDEKNPPIEQRILLKKSATVKIIIREPLREDDLLKFTTDCADCTIELSQDPAQFIGGSAAAKENFIIIAKLIALDKSISTTILAVGDFQQQQQLFTKDEQPYLGLGGDPNTQYRLGMMVGEAPALIFKIKGDQGFEKLPVTATLLPSVKDVPPNNGSLQWYLLMVKDQKGALHLLVDQFRFWDPSVATDVKRTPKFMVPFLQGKGTVTSCAAAFQVFPNVERLFLSPGQFQEFLELLALCLKT